MKPEQQPNGKWRVITTDSDVLASNLTNAQAWRFIDKANKEPVNKRQDTSDWAFGQGASR